MKKKYAKEAYEWGKPVFDSWRKSFKITQKELLDYFVLCRINKTTVTTSVELLRPPDEKYETMYGGRYKVLDRAYLHLRLNDILQMHLCNNFKRILATRKVRYIKTSNISNINPKYYNLTVKEFLDKEYRNGTINERYLKHLDIYHDWCGSTSGSLYLRFKNGTLGMSFMPFQYTFTKAELLSHIRNITTRHCGNGDVKFIEAMKNSSARLLIDDILEYQRVRRLPKYIPEIKD